MKRKPLIPCLAVALLASAVHSNASIATVNFDSGSQTLTASDGATPLSGGNPNIDGDGDVLQLGYFTSGTSTAPFAGTWVALTGKGGANSAFSTTSIGDFTSQGAGDGTYAMSLTFDTTDPTKSTALPAVGTPLAIRVYDGTSIASSTHYQTISSTLASWDWKLPAAPPNNPSINLSLDDTSLFRENGISGLGSAVTGGLFNTNIPTAAPVPEPGTLAVGVLLALTAVGTRRRGNK